MGVGFAKWFSDDAEIVTRSEIRATNYDFFPELDPNSGKKHNKSLIAIFALVNWGLREREINKKRVIKQYIKR